MKNANQTLVQKKTRVGETKLMLVSENLTSYYVLVIELFLDRYFVVQRHGKIGSIWPINPGLNGISIKNQKGYADYGAALDVAQKEIEKKLNKRSGDRIYRHLKVNEFFNEIQLEDGRTRLELVIKDECYVG